MVKIPSPRRHASDSALVRQALERGWPLCQLCSTPFHPERSGYEDTSKCARCWDRINKPKRNR